MYYGEIKDCDIANGEGVRVTLFVSGCTNHCEHCFQPQTWDFTYGQPFTAETEDHILSLLAPGYVGGLTLLGGGPFGEGGVPGKEHLGVQRLHLRRAFNRGQPPPLRGHGRDPVPAGCAGGRPLCGGAEGHLPPLPGQLQPAPHRPAGNPADGGARAPAGPEGAALKNREAAPPFFIGRFLRW